jgi:hypothetical protein
MLIIISAAVFAGAGAASIATITHSLSTSADKIMTALRGEPIVSAAPIVLTLHPARHTVVAGPPMLFAPSHQRLAA